MRAPTGFRYVRSVLTGRWELKEGTQSEVYASNAALVILAATGRLPLEACRLIACVVTPIAIAAPLGVWANQHFPEHGGFLGAIAGVILGLSIGWVFARLIATTLGAAIVGFVLYLLYEGLWVTTPGKPSAEVAQVTSTEAPAPVRAPSSTLIVAPAPEPPAAVPIKEAPPTVVPVAPPESELSEPAPVATKALPVDPAPEPTSANEDAQISEKAMRVL